MTKADGRWVVYEKRGVEFVRLSKRFKTKREAEKKDGYSGVRSSAADFVLAL